MKNEIKYKNSYSFCYDVYSKSYGEIKEEFEKLIAEGNDVIKVDIIS